MTDRSILRAPAVRAYLAALGRALADASAAERELILDDISSHIVGALPADAGTAEIDDVLHRLGDPAAIAAGVERVDHAQRAEPAGAARVQRVSVLDTTGGAALTVLLLAFGGFAAGIGWAVGVAMLLWSGGWRWWEKLIGALVLPGGFAGLAFLFLTATISTPGYSCDPSGSCATLDEVSPAWLPVARTLLMVLLQIASSAFLILRFRAHDRR